MCDPDDIRMITGKCLLAGMTFITWLFLPGTFALQRHGKHIGNKFLTAAALPIDNIGMRNLA